MRRWLVIIARDRPELWVTWASFYGGAGKVDVLFDRRCGLPWPERRESLDRRARPELDSDLQKHGFLVIPQTEIVGASC